jgi:hypothetical protein
VVNLSLREVSAVAIDGGRSAKPSMRISFEVEGLA